MFVRSITRIVFDRQVYSILCRVYCASSTHKDLEFDSKRDYYEDLGLQSSKAKTISEYQIKQAYSKLVRESHPDTNPNISHEESVQRLETIKKAYKVLIDSKLRNQYNMSRLPSLNNPRSIPFANMRNRIEFDQRQKEMEARQQKQQTFSDKMRDKTYAFNYYGRIYQGTDVVDHNEVEYQNTTVHKNVQEDEFPDSKFKLYQQLGSIFVDRKYFYFAIAGSVTIIGLFVMVFMLSPVCTECGHNKFQCPVCDSYLVNYKKALPTEVVYALTEVHENHRFHVLNE